MSTAWITGLLLTLCASSASAQSATSVRAEASLVGDVAVLSPSRRCGAPSGWCSVDRVDLGEATSVRIVTLLDLDGPGFDDVPRGAARRRPWMQIDDATHPAALASVSVDRDGSSRSRWVLVSLRARPTILWQFVASESSPGGGGLSTRGLRFVRPRAGQPLEIHLEGEALPSPGDTPSRPGPPLLFRFVMGADGRYHQDLS